MLSLGIQFRYVWKAETCSHLESYVLLGIFFRNTGYFLRVLKVFDEPLGKSNTERRVKISAGISKEGT